MDKICQEKYSVKKDARVYIAQNKTITTQSSLE